MKAYPYTEIRTFRTMADLLDEFGGSERSVNCPGAFVSGMEEDLEGLGTRTVEVNWNNAHFGNWGHWAITPIMFKPLSVQRRT